MQQYLYYLYIIIVIDDLGVYDIQKMAPYIIFKSNLYYF